MYYIPKSFQEGGFTKGHFVCSRGCVTSCMQCLPLSISYLLYFSRVFPANILLDYLRCFFNFFFFSNFPLVFLALLPSPDRKSVV